jgi:xeroderma pigmentosum group C-complementing protein
LELLNSGLVHLEEAGASRVAKKLCIPYAPCLLGFEGHSGNRTPSIRGIVVHEHNADLVREAHTEFISSQLEREHEKRAERTRTRWKKLIVGLLTKERLEQEYGEDK